MTPQTSTEERLQEKVGDLAAALRATAGVVGPEGIEYPDATPGHDTLLGPNISVFPSRSIHALVRPRSAEQVRAIVEIFARSARSASLHAYSTGRNWGLGSREPADQDTVALDLGGLDRIREIDTDQGWAAIEPGVTQAELSDRLAGTERMLNVTVSSAHTSVLGNALDRGVGLRQQRTEDLLGLEVALPGGALVRVGWWPTPGRTTPLYPHGLGPSLLHLFAQSDLGIVTAATVRLLPRPEALTLVRLNFVEENTEPALSLVRRWVAQGLTRGVVKAYNPAAAKAYQSRDGEFLVHVCVDGTHEAVEALSAAVTREAAASGLFTEISATDATDPRRREHEVARRTERAYAGDPDRTDTLFAGKMGRPAADLDRDGGFLFFLPLVPFTGRALARTGELLEQVFQETGMRCGATLNALSADVVDCVVTMRFDRHGDQVPHAHRALDRLYELFTAEGFTPYRLDVEHRAWARALATDPQAHDLAQRLKDALDPNRAIARGRYA